MRISEEDFNSWWLASVGIEVKKMLLERISDIENMALTEPVIRDVIKNAEFLGRKLEILDLLAMDFKDLMGE